MFGSSIPKKYADKKQTFSCPLSAYTYLPFVFTPFYESFSNYISSVDNYLLIVNR